MEKEPFLNARNLRTKLRPPMSLREMARKLDISVPYLVDLEKGHRGHDGWDKKLKDRFLAEIAAWRNRPTPRVRKIRSDKKIRPQEVHAVA
jgi:hypothetical protein